MKKLFSALLCFVLCFGFAIPVMASNTQEVTFPIGQDGESNEIVDGVITLKAYDDTESAKAENEEAVAAVQAMIPTTMTASYKKVSNAQSARSFVLRALSELDLDSTVTRAVTITQFTASVAGDASNPSGTNGSFTAKVTLSKGEGETLATADVEIIGTVTANAYVDPDAKITVSFRLIGAYPATQKVDLSKSDYMPEYVTWIPTTEYSVPSISTIYDLFVMALNDAGLTSVGADSNYVETIYAPYVLCGYELSQFTNGKKSGWMYTVNGSHPGIGLKDYQLSSVNEIATGEPVAVVWHYVNDWVYEQSDFSGTAGNESYWNKWLDAPDVSPTEVPVESIKLDQDSISLAEEETATLTATVLPSYALNKAVNWCTSDKNVVTVEDGVITAVKAGTATITAKAGGESATCAVTVTEAVTPTVDIEIVSIEGEPPIADVTANVEDGTVTLHVEGDNPCMVIVKLTDGSYERLEAVKNGDGYDFCQDNYAEGMKFIVVLKGDVNRDGVVDASDVVQARAAALKKKALDELSSIVADIDGDGIMDVSDIAKAKAAYLGKIKLDW